MESREACPDRVERRTMYEYPFSGFVKVTYPLKLEYLFPHMLTTCMYGIIFITLGNLSGNAIAFGIYIMSAAGYNEPSRGSVIGLAIAVLSCASLVHVASRRGGIIL